MDGRAVASKEIPFPRAPPCGSRAVCSAVMGAGLNETQLWGDWFHYPLLVIIFGYGISIGSGRMKRWGGVVSHDRDRRR
jgi:hypothetical protein